MRFRDFLPAGIFKLSPVKVALCHKGFDRLLATHFYTQIVRSQLEYGLAISLLSAKDMQQLESCQNICIRRVFGGSSQSSVKVILHMVNQPSMKAQFVFPTIDLPDDTLLAKLLPELQASTFNTQYFHQLRGKTHSVLLSACRHNLIIDPILWLPMTHSERSRTIRWRLGWLPRGIPKACLYYPYVHF
ncbi:uncharacterized protein BX663DRAFT_530093 [Cokeromyces recurvatus]|uniref:uncharacterized protein n=1 Tax=Cokeromyces recurvatus TaxID=90255 RepID=UPI002220739E|nr:uncharacterized protein BX663DRAFT_530093 [Cokeromyces recurvatus]KAI7904529.1 hypothetical protein BX663DRAFT_530093 [Cokeromyces recurvatus]